jgi:hypothetical protein
MEKDTKELFEAMNKQWVKQDEKWRTTTDLFRRSVNEGIKQLVGVRGETAGVKVELAGVRGELKNIVGRFDRLDTRYGSIEGEMKESKELLREIRDNTKK